VAPALQGPPRGRAAGGSRSRAAPPLRAAAPRAMAHAPGAAGGEPELAGARPIVSVGHVVEAAAHRVQSQFAELLGDLPASAPGSRCVAWGGAGRGGFPAGQREAQGRPSGSGAPHAAAPVERRPRRRRQPPAPALSLPRRSPQQLLGFLHSARQQLLRLGALLHDPRKLAVAQRVADQGSVLDAAATHTRALQAAADELFKANADLRWNRAPLFNVLDAADVLATGAAGWGAKEPHGPRCGCMRAQRAPAAAAAGRQAAAGRRRRPRWRGACVWRPRHRPLPLLPPPPLPLRHLQQPALPH
jgi:hypothetical protein